MKIPVTVMEGLTIITLIMASISMLLSSMALWPQWKSSLAALRDAVLWMALVFVIVVAVTFGWKHYASSPAKPSSTPSSSTLDQLTADFP